MEPRTLAAIIVALVTIACVIGALIYANADWREEMGRRRRERKRRDARVREEAAEG